MYYSLIYPFLTYGLLAWGNTYPTSLNPITILQKKTIRIINFSTFNAHTNLLFKELQILKFQDIIILHISIFMYQYKNKQLPPSFDNFFTPITKVHSYNTRLSSNSAYYLPKVRTNYGKFSLRFIGVKTWNKIQDYNKESPSTRSFSKKLKQEFLLNY